MNNYTEYFKKVTYKPKYFLGDRVTGTWNKIKFCGTVAIDHRVFVDEKPNVKVFLDLPLLYKNKVYNILTLTHKDIRKLS